MQKHHISFIDFTIDLLDKLIYSDQNPSKFRKDHDIFKKHNC